ncbi:retroviral-like aspartic protease family protein [Stenotrophomonas bentonitica]|uniref:retroviral-like aspartic protease family protein n=1 Tax=Stenotrophomonas bentonitica TaxID=1450134 RepID=UPI0031BAA2E5
MSSCLTRKFPNRAHVIDSECQVSAAFDPGNGDPNQPFTLFNAIWDTGATGSVITQHAAAAMGISPSGMTVVHGVNGQHNSPTYLVNIMLPGGVMFSGLQVTEGVLGGHYNVLIGMDIIGAGDFAVSFCGGKTVMSFRVPPGDIATDYVQQHNDSVRRSLIKERPNSPRKKGKKGRG